MLRKRFIVLLGGLLAVTMADQPILAREVYRYYNDKGVPVIDDTIPPEFVSKGYDILDSSTLSVIKHVPRALTKEELRLRNTDEARAQLKKEEARRQKARDKSLLLRYSSVQDIKAAQKRAVEDLEIRVSILKSNLTTIKVNIEKEQKKAADIERRGAKVPPEVTQNIGILRREIEDTEQSIAARRKEIANVKGSYQRDIDRFKILSNRFKMH